MKRTFLLVSAFAVAACATTAVGAFTEGVDVAGMDRSVTPGDDFFGYANGAWLKATEIPADRSSWGGNAILASKVDQDVADIIGQAGTSMPRPGSDAAKIADYYAAFMDEAGIEKKGLAPLQPGLAQIDAISDSKSLAAYLGSQLRADVDVMNNTRYATDNIFGLWVAADFDEPTKYSPFLLQGGLSLPNREYYITDSERMETIRAGFRAHIAAVLTLAGVSDAQARAGRIFDLENRIAHTHASVRETGDPSKGNNHWTRGDLDTKAPGMDWNAYLGAAGLNSQPGFVIWQPAAFTGESALVASVPVDTWKEYLTFHYIARNSGVLPKAFVEERFNFFGKTLSGTPALGDRWKRGVAVVNGAMGEAVGKLYAARYFPESSKSAISEMVDNIKTAFGKRLDALTWMDPKTLKEAKAKLDALKVGVGYPDVWRDYSALEVKADDAFGNAQRAAKFDSDFKIARLGTPVDRGEWVMNPQLVNAVNLPILNALNFPAAELQPPHYDPNAPAAVNYASIGAIIGHEISHSFDNDGSQFDSTGRMRNWWTPEDFEHFEASGDALAKQFDGYRPFPDLAVKGEQTLGENIADVAGLSAAYDGWRTTLGGKAAPMMDGLTGDQQFFLSYAQTWRYKAREPALRQQILTDGHAPAQYRALTVRNLDAWYPAFDVKPGETLYLAPGERVQVW